MDTGKMYYAKVWMKEPLLHEVVRLSGINISIDNSVPFTESSKATTKYPVAGFIFFECEDFFRFKQRFHEENESWVLMVIV